VVELDPTRWQLSKTTWRLASVASTATTARLSDHCPRPMPAYLWGYGF